MKTLRLLYLLLTLMLVLSLKSNAQDSLWVHYFSGSDLPSMIINYIVIDKEGTKWIASGKDLVKMIEQDMTIYETDSDFDIRELGQIAIDRDNNKWIRTRQAGLLRFDNASNWTHFNQDNGFPGTDNVTAIAVDSSNIIWVGSTGGLAKYENDVWSNVSEISGKIVNAIEIDSKNNIWVGTSKGLYIQKDGQEWDIIDPSVYKLASDYIISLEVYDDNYVWIGTKGGFAEYTGTEWINMNPTGNNDKLNNNIWSITAGDDCFGDIYLWVGFKFDSTYNRKIISAKHDSIGWHFFGPENSKLPNNDIQTIVVDDSCHVWFGTYWGGMLEFKDRGIYSGNILLVADFFANPLEGVAPLTVRFTDTSTGEPDAWLWHFGDGNSDTVQNPQHIYADTGVYSVTLIISKGNVKDTLTINDYIHVSSPEELKANFIAEPIRGCAPLSVTFTDLSTGGVRTRLWNLGGTATDTTENPVYVYTEPGIYSITLNVASAQDFNSLTKENYIEVLDCSKSIALKYPDGDKLFANAKYNIIWEASASVEKVYLFYSLDNGGTWNQISSLIPASPNYYAWTVPDVVANDCLMKIIDSEDSTTFDINNFSIIKASDFDIICVDANDYGSIVSTKYPTDPNKIYRITFLGSYSLFQRTSFCENENDLSCGFDAAYVYEVPDKAINDNKWPAADKMNLNNGNWLGDTISYVLNGMDTLRLSYHIGFRFNGEPLPNLGYNPQHTYTIEKTGTGDYFTISIIDSIWSGGGTIPQYGDNKDEICMIIEEIDTIEVDYCGFKLFWNEDSTEVTGMQLEAGVFVEDTSSITGKRNLLATIDEDELGIVVNGKFICPIDSIVCDTEEIKSQVPVHIGLLVDRSGSMDWKISEKDSIIRIDALKNSLKVFIDNLRDEDFAFLMSFNQETTLEQNWTNSKTLLKSSVDQLVADGGTRLWGALDAALNKMKLEKTPRPLILLSDGGNTEIPNWEESQILEKVKNTAELPIYIIALGLSPDSMDVEGRMKLGLIAEASGGKVFDVDDSEKLNEVYQQIIDEITSYDCCRIYFTSEIDCEGWLKLVYSPDRDRIITRVFDYDGCNVGGSTGVSNPEDDSFDMNIAPNPFDKSASLSYNLYKLGAVKIIITDMMGNRITEISRGMQAEGEYNYIIDGSKMTSGTYMAIVMLDGVTQSRKIIVIH